MQRTKVNTCFWVGFWTWIGSLLALALWPDWITVGLMLLFTYNLAGTWLDAHGARLELNDVPRVIYGLAVSGFTRPQTRLSLELCRNIQVDFVKRISTDGQTSMRMEVPLAEIDEPTEGCVLRCIERAGLCGQIAPTPDYGKRAIIADIGIEIDRATEGVRNILNDAVEADTVGIRFYTMGAFDPVGTNVHGWTGEERARLRNHAYWGKVTLYHTRPSRKNIEVFKAKVKQMLARIF